MITLEEYKEKAKGEEYAPGWDAIDDAIVEIYGEQEPQHFGTLLTARAIFGGPEHLDGYSIYQSENGKIPYVHIITYGMSELYGNEEAYGKEYSKWGYEMTIKVVQEEGDDYYWAMNMLGNLARYTNTNEHAWFEENQYVLGDGSPIKIGADSKISSLLIVKDTELQSKDTVHGRLDFMQLVGITYEEAKAIRRNIENLSIILEAMRKENPLLITDLKRTREYLEDVVE